MSALTNDEIAAFRQLVWDSYRQQGRHDLPWRQPEADGTFDPYKILVSEIMLQQTQVSRVRPKYDAFLRQFPSVKELASAPLGSVLVAWQGLGYNRRAKYLWAAACSMREQFENAVPAAITDLTRLPGVGVNTAGAIAAYAFNQPAVFLETNIRTVLIHRFFPSDSSVSEQALRRLAAATLDPEAPRQWYWALVDYGALLKRTAGNTARRSRSYHPQSRFQGSLREQRGAVIRLLASRPLSWDQLHYVVPDDRLPGILSQLEQEGLISRIGSQYTLP